MALPHIIGTCVFRNEGDGCITSKYINNRSVPLTESCKLVEGSEGGQPFVGRYATSWINSVNGDDIATRSGILTIARGRQLGSYILNWQAVEGDSYEGLGMLFGDLLVAAYWSR